MIPNYQPDGNYAVGDEVQHRGKTWRAVRHVFNQPQIDPRVSSEFWEDVTPEVKVEAPTKG